MTREELIAHVRDAYGAEPEYLWARLPSYFVFRHVGSRKWFAVVGDPTREQLGLSGAGRVDLLNVKCGALLGGSYWGKRGIVPAYHMNKTHWLGALLDGSADDETVRELLALSYELTKRRG